ncbi:MAG TPA: GH116 family glycosyl-hydrolase, partial [Armatimonadota bacterium]|nr:GH116 family glycosyl-hydrolase [Armatimonadota bacterium]
MIPFSHDELYRVGAQRVFTGASLTEIAFPLGGIGTGTISLGGRGNLRDPEIYTRPNKGAEWPFTLFALWARAEGEAPAAKILEGRVPPPYRKGFGESQPQLLGVSRFREASFTGEYPVATLALSDPEVPVTASLRAWNPFIPLNVHDSALPVAIFEWTFTNPRDTPVAISLAATMSNTLTARGDDGNFTGKGATNAYRAVGALKGVLLSHPGADPNDPRTGTLALATTWEALDAQTRWYRGGWWDKCHLFWDDFAEDGRVTNVLDTDPSPGAGDVAALVLRATVPAGGAVTLPIFITWHFPKMANPWSAHPESPWGGEADYAHPLDLYVGAHFADAWAVADYVTDNLSRLRRDTELFRETLFGSTLPDHVIEAITTQASIMRTPTCFLLADGRFFGWEGAGDTRGCCFGNCTHVWNYEQAVAFLFPSLERTMRETEFLHNTRETGNMAFRTYLPPGARLFDFKPCADGQMGAIIQLYRDWQLSGDDAFLRAVWPGARRALEYAWTMTPERMDRDSGAGAIGSSDEKRSIDSLWDPDKDGVMEGEQHNTYDIEFFGPNTLCTALYLGALRAGEAIARYLGETAAADEYRAIAESGRAKVDAELWNGEYYIQQVRVIPEVTVPPALHSPPAVTCACQQAPGGTAAALESGDVMPKYQYGEGCLSDQLLGQWAAHVAGLGYLLDPDKVRTAVKAIFTSNFRAPIGGFSNVQR